MSTKNYYLIYSLTMANYLVRKGFNIIKVDNSEKDNKLKVFHFDDCPELRNTMSQFNRQGV